VFAEVTLFNLVFQPAVRKIAAMRITLALAVLSLFTPYTLISQCSDAGVCVISSRRTPTGHQLSVSYVFGRSGKADELTIHTIQIGGEVRIFKDSRLVVVLPWLHITGPSGSASGMGDLTVLWDQSVLHLSPGRFSVQLAGKFATGTTNSDNLPQAHQPGLGTNDLILGISLESDPWLMAVGYQLSRGRSSNSITRLKRGDDVFARLGYKIQVEEFSPGLEILAIKRLEESSVLDPAATSSGSFVNVAGSDQFQVNILGTLSFAFDDNIGLRSSVALPLRNRRVNVDGLTRSLTLSVGAQYSF
jgi:hypothetical protein